MLRGRHIQNNSPTMASAVTPVNARTYAPDENPAASGQPQVTYRSATRITGNTTAAPHQRRVRTPLRHHCGAHSTVRPAVVAVIEYSFH